MSIYEVKLWRCGIVGGKSPANQATITRKMMREARTLDPNYPYLMNASTSPTFGVALVNITDIESIEDGFLSDYPRISIFSIHAPNVIKKLKRNMFAGAGDLTLIQIRNCSELIEIDGGIFAGMNRLNRIMLYNSSPKAVSGQRYPCPA